MAGCEFVCMYVSTQHTHCSCLCVVAHTAHYVNCACVFLQWCVVKRNPLESMFTFSCACNLPQKSSSTPMHACFHINIYQFIVYMYVSKCRHCRYSFLSLLDSLCIRWLRVTAGCCSFNSQDGMHFLSVCIACAKFTIDFNLQFDFRAVFTLTCPFPQCKWLLIPRACFYYYLCALSFFVSSISCF